MNKRPYLCHLLVLSSPMLMMHTHTNLKLAGRVLGGSNAVIPHIHGTSACNLSINHKGKVQTCVP